MTSERGDSPSKQEAQGDIALHVLAGGVSSPDNAYLVRAGAARVLLDAGGAQSSDWVHALEQPPHAVWLSHVHPDHAQGWSELVRTHGLAPTWASPQTRRWLGSAWLRHAPHAARSASATVSALRATDAVEVACAQDAVILSQHPCGHIPGSSALYMDITTAGRFHRLCYLSDFCLHPQHSVAPAALESWSRPDTLVIECALAHVEDATPEAVGQGARALSHCLGLEGPSLWPVSSFGQAQEVIAAALVSGVRPAVWSSIDAMKWSGGVDALVDIQAARAALHAGRMVVLPGAHMRDGVSRVLGLEWAGRASAHLVSVNAHPQGSLAAALWSGRPNPRWGGRCLHVAAQTHRVQLWNHAPLEDIVGAVMTLGPQHVVLVHGQRKGIARARRALRRAGYTGRLSAPKSGAVVRL